MKIAIIGSGAAGSVFAAYLKRGGAELWLVDRYKAHMDAVERDGLVFVCPECVETLTGFHVCDTAVSEKMDVVILMVKATQNEDVLPSLSECIGSDTVVLSLQNGLGNEETIAKYIPRRQIMYGFGTIGTELPEPGKCISRPERGVAMHFGAVEKNSLTERIGRELASVFCKGGCEARFEEDIRPLVWKKAVSNSGYNTLSALLRLKVGIILENDNGNSLIRSVWREGCQVAESVIGVDLWPELEKEFPRLKEGFAEYYSSMAQDVLFNKKQTEIELLNGAIIKYGIENGIPTPVNDTLAKMIRCIQENYEKQFSKQ